MVIPGVMIRNPFVKIFDAAERAALTAAQAISIAITVVLPAPVASFSAIRKISGLASRFDSSKWRKMPVYGRRPRATSLSQIAFSTASIWQKNGRGP